MTIPAGKRRCCRCKKTKSLEQFAKTARYCRPCFSAYNRKRVEERKRFANEFVRMLVEPLGEDRRRGRPVVSVNRPKWNGIRGEKYQGHPCSNGHNGVRYVKTNACVECANKEHKSAAPKKGRKKPVRAAHLRTPLTKPNLPPAPPANEVETVEQFLARGGQIKTVAHGATGYIL